MVAELGDGAVFPSTVTKDGQNPFTQLKSLLHEDWSIALFRPNSVWTGIIETQLDWTPQSPQPSHTSVFKDVEAENIKVANKKNKKEKLESKNTLGDANEKLQELKDKMDGK